MEQERIQKKTLEGHFEGKRMDGRPRVQWEEMVKRDARNLLDVGNWRKMAIQRDEWKAIIEEAMVRTKTEKT
jgi:hypothetical protein